MGGNAVHNQISIQARQIYQKLMQGAAAKYGPESIPADQQEKLKQASWTQAQQLVHQSMAQRRAQQQMLLQQQQQQQLQQQQQQQAAMQGMGGMMGHQGM
jgi:transcription factor SPT20